MQGDGKKIMDPEKQKVICSRLRMELVRPLRVEVMSRGPDTELLVANPVELAGKGRPLVFYDITLAITSLSIRIFSVGTEDENALVILKNSLVLTTDFISS